MRIYHADYQNDELTAHIYDSVMRCIELVIVLSREGHEAEVIHIGRFDTYDEAEQEMREVFPNVRWR